MRVVTYLLPQLRTQIARGDWQFGTPSSRILPFSPSITPSPAPSFSFLLEPLRCSCLYSTTLYPSDTTVTKTLHACICYFWVTLHVLEVSAASLDKRRIPFPPGDQASPVSANGFKASTEQHDPRRYFLPRSPSISNKPTAVKAAFDADYATAAKEMERKRVEILDTQTR